MMEVMYPAMKSRVRLPWDWFVLTRLKYYRDKYLEAEILSHLLEIFSGMGDMVAPIENPKWT